MSDRWQAVQEDDGTFEVKRNGHWYTSAEDVYEVIGLASNQRAKQVSITWMDGLTEIRRL